MSSDNTTIKDADQNEYTLRAKDVSQAGDGSLRRSMVLATAYPVDYSSGGCFHVTGKSTTMAAGLVGGSTIFTFLNPSATLLAAVRKVKLSAWSLTSTFNLGTATFDMMIARSFTAIDTGGAAVTGLKLRNSMAAPTCQIVCATTAALTAGTRTLSGNPIESFSVTVPVSANNAFTSSPMKMLDKAQGEHPLMLAQNEGFVIQATLPGAGTWGFAACVEWDEVPLAQY